jgi:hypothetical protein
MARFQRRHSDNGSATQDRKSPAWSKRCLGIEVAVWEGSAGEGDDERQTLQLRVKKTYYDESKKEYVEAKGFFPQEVAVLASLLQDGFAAMTNMAGKK